MTEHKVSMTVEEMEQVIHLQCKRIAELENEVRVKELIVEVYRADAKKYHEIRDAEESKKAPEEGA